MMSRRFRGELVGTLRFGAAILCILAPLGVAPAQASRLLPENFFDQIPATNDGQAGIEADELHFNSETGVITAAGSVGLSYIGYFANADRMVFNQKSRELTLEGNVRIVDPGGVEYTTDRVEVTNQFKDAVLDSMVMVTPDGAMLTGSQVRKVRGEVTEVDDGVYAPCGTCIDSKGRRIGWRVRTDKMVQNTAEDYSELHQPVLEVLGVPIAWFPWIRVPNLADSGFQAPRVAFSEKIGTKLSVPYYYAVDNAMGLLLTPSLISKQGLLLGAEFRHSLPGLGSYSVSVNGINQLDPGSFNAGFGDTDLRGSIQTSGRFTPAENWTMGWSYSAFTDPAFLTDYLITADTTLVNEAYAQYLTADTYADARVQEFRLLGEVTQATQDQQAALLPRIDVDHVVDLGPDAGTVHLNGDLIQVARAADHVAANAINYRLGTQENKTHGTVQGDWSNQYLLGPAAVTPMAGLRLDYANYDGSSVLQPGATSLFSATPMVAVDARVPFVAYDGGSTYLIEPVAQAYYRGDTTAPGITNDNAQSFTFDEANLFNYNKFSGTDRQETGLRANLGLHYLANFADGSYIDAVVGQSYQLDGTNSLATADAVNAGAGAGLDGTSTDIVAGVRLGMGPVTVSSKARYDIPDGRIAAAAINATYAADGWFIGADYSYMAEDPARGFNSVQQDIGGWLSVPLADYWRATAAIGWDITASQMIDYSAGLTYDDGYFEAGAKVTSTGPSIYDPQDIAYTLSLKLKAPDGTGIGIDALEF